MYDLVCIMCTYPYCYALSGLYPDDALEGLAVDQVVGGVEDMIVDTVPFLFAPEADKVRGNL